MHDKHGVRYYYYFVLVLFYSIIITNFISTRDSSSEPIILMRLTDCPYSSPVLYSVDYGLQIPRIHHLHTPYVFCYKKPGSTGVVLGGIPLCCDRRVLLNTSFITWTHLIPFLHDLGQQRSKRVNPCSVRRITLEAWWYVEN